MAADVGGLIADIGLNVAGLRQDIGKANRELQRGTNRMNRHLGGLRRQVNNVTRSFRGLVGVISVGLLARHMKQTIDSADQMLKLTQRIGGTTEAFSELEFVADRSGVAFNTLTMGLQRMLRRVAEAAEGTGEAKAALKELRLDAQQLRMLAIDQQFEVIADALFGVKNESDRVRLAMKLFDSEGVALLQTMNKGSAGIRELREEARKLGVTLSTDQAQAAAEAKDQITNLSAEWSGFTRNLTIDSIPAISAVIGKLDDFREAIKGVAEVAAGAKGFGAQADALESQIESLSLERNRITAQLEGLSKPNAGKGGLLGDLASWLRDDPSIGELQTRLAEINEELKKLKAQQLDVLTGVSPVPAGAGSGLTIPGSVGELVDHDAFESLKRAYETAEQEVARKMAEFDAVAHMFPPEEQDRIREAIKKPLVDGIEEIRITTKKRIPEVVDGIDSEFEKLALSIGGSLQRSMSDAFLGIETSFSDMLARMAADFLSSSLLSSIASIIPGPFGNFLQKALPGFKDGGSFTVGGSGGPDSQLVAFRATPGEPVAVGDRFVGRESGGATVIQNIDIGMVFPPQLEAAILNIAGPAARAEAIGVLRAQRGRI